MERERDQHVGRESEREGKKFTNEQRDRDTESNREREGDAVWV